MPRAKLLQRSTLGTLRMTVLEEQDMRDMEKVIGKLAYELWEQAGRPDNRSDEFWFTARFESQRREETGETQPGAPVRRRAEASS